jgi:AcrR family transcriptional regulator
MPESPSSRPRERLLDAVERLINSASIHSTGVDAIVRQSGVARKSFYLYFRSKDELVAVALQRRGLRWMEWFVNCTLESGGTPAEQLLGMFDVLRDWFASDDFRGCALLNAASEVKHTDLHILNVSRLHKERLLAFIERLCIAHEAVRYCHGSVPAAGCTANTAGIARQLLILVDGAITVALLESSTSAAADAQEAARCVLGMRGET